ncbi:sensor histidine kinase [Pedobacter insulae]|uniref:histidine kinase n=1 Tax=Pedobacter insulae TaxID=414048 RepID=A0A1I2T5L1_9SPHI|nr:HAMP domain-containing sensor histidine kinase [Pedobacter insulae]SFG57531.1 HAMP domain-containing protein [Pedobacter insulae]
MSIGGKIRFLLLIFGICCIITALSLDHAITRADLLTHEANQLQEKLASKERTVQSFLADPAQRNAAKNFNKNGNDALKFIDTYRDLGINILVFKDNVLQFWSSSKVLPVLSRIKEGSSFYGAKNGYYELIKKTEDHYTFLFVISLKTQFVIENQYLKNQIVPELFSNNSLDLAGFTDKDTRNIFSINKDYLFQVKLKDSYTGGIYTNLQLWLWIVGILTIFLFVNSYCTWLVNKGYVLTGVVLLTLFFAALRLSDLYYGWFNHQFDLEIFNPSIYAQSDFLPSLGDFLLNVIAITWVSLFAYTHRKKYSVPNWMAKNETIGIIFHLFLLIILGGIGFLTDEVFFGLIDNSKINFDITNIINLSFISFICIIILCLVWFNIFLIANIFIELSKLFNVTHKQRVILFAGSLAVYFIYRLLGEFNVYFLVYALFIFILCWNNYIQQRKFYIGVYVLLFFCMAFLSALKYVKYIDIKERSTRAGIARKLMLTDEPKVISSIAGFENRISADSMVVDYFQHPEKTQSLQIHNYINKSYLDGYLSRFEYKIFEYNQDGLALSNENSIPLGKYRELVRSGSIKIENSDYFYRINDTFGFQKYFGIIPISHSENLIGFMVIELTSQSYDINSHFPELLIDGKLKSDEDYSLYSFAFYKNHKLYGQSGKYTYETVTTRFEGVRDKVIFLNEHNPDYNFAIYKQNTSKVIVISKERMSYTIRLATLSFFFLVFILFSGILYGLLWLFNNINNQKSGWFNVNRYLMINANKILYRTRIQVTIVLAVVATLLIVGWTTFFYIKNEYMGQQEDEIREKIRKVQLAYEKEILTHGLRNDEEASFKFNQFADVNAAYLNLYDAEGDIYLTSLPKMYEYGILGPKMGAKAITTMRTNLKSEFINTGEKIGTFTYAAGYAPIRNAQNQTIAYIGLPYYSNESDYQEKIGLFINTLINIYALVFVLIGVLAVFLADQITHPLTFIQESFKKTKLGQTNQPIVWHRQDEIGSMIKEYNKMLTALEMSAVKLARSERESAWREMAKQVAHEIKNPLTPLKLGVQLLEKSWREKDPNFEKKFASFNKSFIEQIDSLATIASEFSNFAKMPDTKLENLRLIPIIEQAIRVFNSIDNVEISMTNQVKEDLLVLGDKDQLLRTFNNLLKNAIEAAEGKEKGVIRIKVINDQKFAFVEVEDNGKGIEENLQNKIFVPNFTTKSSGTGLGLAFVKQAIENAGGTIHFVSVPNAGTTFYLSFPLAGDLI